MAFASNADTLKPLRGFVLTGITIGVIAAVHSAAAVGSPSCRNMPANDLTSQQFARCVTGIPDYDCSNVSSVNVSVSTCCRANLETAGWQGNFGAACSGADLDPALCN